MDEKNLITVRGTGTESFAPDLIVISMSVETVDKDYSKTTELQAEKISQITAALIEAGFDKKALTTSEYNISPRYENYQKMGDWKRKFTGYGCTQSMNLRFEQSSEKLNKAINTLSSCKSSAPQFDISFTVKDKEKVSDKLLTLAVKDAKHKAQVLAKAAGEELGQLKAIDYNPVEINVYSPTRMLSARNMVAADRCSMAESAEINPEEIRASASVTMTWQLGTK